MIFERYDRKSTEKFVMWSYTAAIIRISDNYTFGQIP